MPPAIIGGVIAGVGALGAAAMGSHAASSASHAQTAADQAAIQEQQRQFDITNANFAPFRQAGLGALDQYGNLVGTNGAAPQAGAISALQASPYYQALYRNGQEAVLQNASATGGIRGGNTQDALARFGSDTLAQTIQQQLGNLSGLVTVGAGATNSAANYGQQTANNISTLTQDQGSARAGAALAQGGVWGGAIGNLTGAITRAIAPNGFGGLSRIPAPGGSGPIMISPTAGAQFANAFNSSGGF